mgnify:CR=1 FL=1
MSCSTDANLTLTQPLPNPKPQPALTDRTLGMLLGELRVEPHRRQRARRAGGSGHNPAQRMLLLTACLLDLALTDPTLGMLLGEPRVVPSRR